MCHQTHQIDCVVAGNEFQEDLTSLRMKVQSTLKAFIYETVKSVASVIKKTTELI